MFKAGNINPEVGRAQIQEIAQRAVDMCHQPMYAVEATPMTEATHAFTFQATSKTVVGIAVGNYLIPTVGDDELIDVDSGLRRHTIYRFDNPTGGTKKPRFTLRTVDVNYRQIDPITGGVIVPFKSVVTDNKPGFLQRRRSLKETAALEKLSGQKRLTEDRYNRLLALFEQFDIKRVVDYGERAIGFSSVK